MPGNRKTGKLAVILHADIVGSTLLVQRDEHVAHERIQRAFRRLDGVVTRYHGRVRELRGDALLAEFERASDAVTAALAFQVRHAARNVEEGVDIRADVRVGIAMGEVVIADDTVTGAGVVLAQRIEQLAEPGGVCITGAIDEALPARMPYERTDLGEQEFKGFEKKVRVYRIGLRPGESIPPPDAAAGAHASRWKGWAAATTGLLLALSAGGALLFEPWQSREEPASVERMEFPLPDRPSIAVLPFDNMSGDAEQEYFVDGMTEDLITDLSKISGLFVIARNSSFSYKGRPVKVGQVAEDLGVRYVLEGSVRRAGDTVRINAQLIDATTGGHLWAERYDGTLENVFALQDQVTGKIVAALEVSLTGDEKANRVRSETHSPQAYDAFLQGWEQYRRGTPDGLRESITYLEQAVERDPAYSRAYAALAAVYWRIYSNLWYEQVLGDGYSFQAVEKARVYLKEAMKSPTPLAYQVAAEITAHAWDIYLYEPIVQAEHAIALDPNDPAGHIAKATALLKAGRAVEAEQQVREAMRLDPHHPTSYLVLLGRTEFASGRYSDAAATFERAVARDSENHRTYIYLVAAYGHLGRRQDAELALRKANELRTQAGWASYSLSSVDDLLWVGDSTLFKEGLRKAGVTPDRDWTQLISTVSKNGSIRYEIEGAEAIDVQEARKLHDQDVPFIDVSKNWQQEHIPGSRFLMIWFTGGDTEFNEVRLARIAQRSQPLVIYSSGLERRAANACAKAVSWGFQNVYYFEHGLKNWKAAGFALAKGS